MKKLILLLTFILFFGCTKDDIVEERQLLFEIALDGDSFDPYERYSLVNSYGGTQLGIDGRQHFAMYLLDSDAVDNGLLLDVGTYTWENPNNKYAGVEIPGNDEYIVWNEVIVGEIIEPSEEDFYDPLLICLTAEGEFYNPYIERTMTLSMRLENFPIGQDITSTPYGYLLD